MEKLSYVVALCMMSFFVIYAMAQESQKTERPKPAKPALNIPNFYCPINDKVGTGGQPSLPALEEAAKQGYKSVLNLRTAQEKVDLKAEEAKIRELGMQYFNLPIETANPKDEQVPEFLKIVRDEKNYPMLIHCGSGNRVGAFWMIHRVLDDKWPLERAEEEAKKIGLTNPDLQTFARRYIESHKGGSR